MAKSELYTNPLIPFVLVAGILSGSLLRTSPPGHTGKTGGSNGNADKAESSVPPLPWISNLRPVMESLDATLGGAASTSASSLDGAPAVVLKDKGPARDAQVLDAMATMRSGFDRLASPLEPAICGDPSALRDDARVLGGWLLPE